MPFPARFRLPVFVCACLLFAGCASSGIDWPEDPGGGGPEKDDGAVTLEYTPFKTYAYVSADLCPDRDFVIDYPERLVSASVSPRSRGVACMKEGKRARFRITRPGQYVVYLNRFRVLLFVEEPEVLPENAVSILSKGVDATGWRDETVRIQAAIDEVAGTGRTLLFPPGTYSVSQLRICDREGVKIHLCRGAVLRARTSEADPFGVTDLFGEAEESVREPGKKAGVARGFIVIFNSRDVHISGYGAIDGNGYAQRVVTTRRWNSDSRGRHRNLLIADSEDVTVEGILSLDPGSWNVHPILCRRVTFRNMKLLNELDYAPTRDDPFRIDHDRVNADGFDPDSSSDVLIERCFGYCADDNVAVKTSQYNNRLGDVDGVTVRGCVFLTQKSSLKVGTETAAASMSNILFEDNDVIEADRAISLYNYDGTEMRNVRYLNNRVERNYPDVRQALFFIEVKKRVATSRVGRAQVEIRGLRAEEAFPNNSCVVYRDGADPSDLSVTLAGVTVAGVPVTDAEGGRITVQYPSAAPSGPEVKFE